MRSILLTAILSAILTAATFCHGETISFDQTLDRLINETTRGRILAGQRDVSYSKFEAEKIGYYIPEISINSTLPTYNVSEEYNTYPGIVDPILFHQTNISGVGNLQFKHKLITGGDLTFQTRFDIRNNEYPSPFYDAAADSTVFKAATDKRRLGNFFLQFQQPILQTSASRSAYYSARDNMEKAQIQWRIDRAELKKEGINAFFDLLLADLELEIANANSELAAYTSKWDSVKYNDSVITESAWLTSKSARLEKQLLMYDAEANYQEKLNNFTHLMDYPVEAKIELLPPPIPLPVNVNNENWYIANAERTGSTELARMNMESAERQLGEARLSGGLNGTLNASYSLGKGTVTRGDDPDENIDTKDWRISVDFTYPIFDGGASGANIHSLELAFESARLEYNAAQRKAGNDMQILLRRIDINNSKMSLLKQEVELAEQKLVDAEKRHEEGIISDGTLLENRIYYLEAEKKHHTTLKDYYLDLTELEKTGER